MNTSNITITDVVESIHDLVDSFPQYTYKDRSGCMKYWGRMHTIKNESTHHLKDGMAYTKIEFHCGRTCLVNTTSSYKKWDKPLKKFTNVCPGCSTKMEEIRRWK